MYFVCLKSWLSAGFDKSQFLVVRCSHPSSRSRARIGPNLGMRKALSVGGGQHALLVRLGLFGMRPAAARTNLWPRHRPSPLAPPRPKWQVPSAKLRMLRAPELLRGISNFTGLHYNEAVLAHRHEEFTTHCEAPDSAANRAKAEKNEAAPLLVNSHSAYEGHNAQKRSLLSPQLHAEYARLTTAYGRMLDELQLPHIAP